MRAGYWPLRVHVWNFSPIHSSIQPSISPSFISYEGLCRWLVCVCLCLCLSVCVCARVIPLMIPHGEQARGRCDTPDVILYFFFLLCIPLLPPDRRTNMHIKHVHAHKQIYKPLRTCSRNCLGSQRNNVNNELIDDQLWENVFRCRLDLMVCVLLDYTPLSASALSFWRLNDWK